MSQSEAQTLENASENTLKNTLENAADLDTQGERTEDSYASGPSRITKSELLKAHGEAGWLMVRLQRYALLGWALFGVLFVVLIGSYTLNLLLPKPVMVVDQNGQYIGDVNFLAPLKRQDDELMSTGKRFLSFYLSMNSETIFEDYAIAMNMMEKPLFEQTRNNIQKDGYLARISKARSRSHIQFDADEAATHLIERKGLSASSRYKGTLTVFPLEGSPIESPFDITLFMMAIPSSSLRTSGIEITAIHDN